MAAPFTDCKMKLVTIPTESSVRETGIEVEGVEKRTVSIVTEPLGDGTGDTESNHMTHKV